MIELEYTNFLVDAIKLGSSFGLITSAICFFLGYGTNHIIKMFKFISK